MVERVVSLKTELRPEALIHLKVSVDRHVPIVHAGSVQCVLAQVAERRRRALPRRSESLIWRRGRIDDVNSGALGWGACGARQGIDETIAGRKRSAGVHACDTPPLPVIRPPMKWPA